eukprot:GDKI01040299.1.p1 GENE.GDKI01040299.1~~GDKI01040299.1.p1  ORF type:complete len:516 (-),score=143.85 GDKI01040299.1:198-1745(-)
MLLPPLLLLTLLGLSTAALPAARLAAEERTYTSPAVDALIEGLMPLFIDSELATLFANCLPNTLDTTVSYAGPSWYNSGPDAFVITGDINAMWLRDSANQVMPYVPYARGDVKLQMLLEGLIARHAHSINIDPYANAFNYNNSGEGWQQDIRTPPMQGSVFEGKYEIDSLGAFLKLSYWYYRTMGTGVLDKVVTDDWLTAVGNTLTTIETMQKDTGMASNPPYLFQRMTTVASDTLIMNGRGPAGKPFGLTRSLFRPSDDAVLLPYNIPGNAMACAELKHLETMLAEVKRSDVTKLKLHAAAVRESLCSALETVINHSKKIKSPIPYEIDGEPSTSGSNLMDDANIPSLLSLPYLGYMDRTDSLYRTTRDFVWSPKNPFFFSGPQGEGIGGPHIGPPYAWPMSLIMRAMTSSDDDEVKHCLALLVQSSADTGFLHEAFNVNNVHDYTRSWFAWVNGLFGELILQLVVERPHLIIRPNSVSKAQGVVKIPVSLQAQLDIGLRSSFRGTQTTHTVVI